jgi:hypothetical protein
VPAGRNARTHARRRAGRRLAAVAFAPNLTSAIALLLARFALSQMGVPTRQAYVVGVVDPSERTAAAGRELVLFEVLEVDRRGPHGVPGVPGDLQDHDRDHEPDDRVGDIRAKTNHDRAADDTE